MGALGTIMASIAETPIVVAAARGVAPGPLYRLLGLTPEEARRPSRRVALEALFAVWEACMAALRDPATFSADGLHPSTAGHRTVARESARYLHEHLGIDFDMGGDQA